MGASRRAWLVAAGLVLVAAAGVFAASQGSGMRPTPRPPARVDLRVTMHGRSFGRETYRVAAGETTAIRLENRDGVLHTFTIPALDVDRSVFPGRTARLELTAPAGTYTIYCRPHADVEERDPDKAGMAASLLAE